MRDDESDEEMYSVTSSKTIYKRSRSFSKNSESGFIRSSPLKILVHSDSDERSGSKEYWPVTKWAVDYNNRNYVRSKCNKNIGLHRTIKGQPLNWRVEYDNRFFSRSKVDAPKGLHRMMPDVERKYAPDDDDLADADGWEFEYGPEFDQPEQDVTYIPEGRIVGRGCYRWYGTKRNNSDFDFSEQEDRENLLNEELERELKYGREFLQSDVPYMAEQEERRYSRGGYRFYEVQRNAYDVQPEMESVKPDPEWRRKHHCNGFRYLDLDMCEFDSEAEAEKRYVSQGKPFKRTILNKVYELRRRSDSPPRSARYATRTSLMPGEGEKTLYHGIPDRFPFKERRSPSLRHVFKRREDTKMSQHGGRLDKKYEDTDEMERRYEELNPKYKRRLRHLAGEKRRSRGRSIHSEEEEYREPRRSGTVKAYAYKVTPTKEEDMETGAKEERSDTDEDVRETLQTWRENNEKYKTTPITESHRREIEKRRKSSDHCSKNKVVDKRNRRQSAYDTNEYESGTSTDEKKRNRKDGHEVVPEKRKDKNKLLEHKAHGSKDKRKIVDEEFETISTEKESSVKKMPPHVQERIEKIREKMERNVQRLEGNKRKDPRTEKSSNIEAILYKRLLLHCSKKLKDIDLMEHKAHPKDTGETHGSEYEKYITKNGSEIWLKKEEKYSELHHRSH